MEFQNMHGAFGSNEGRDNLEEKKKRKEKGPLAKKHRTFSSTFVTAESIADIICMSFFIIFIITVICCWDSFSDALFENLIFPVIYVSSKIIGAIVTVWAAIKLFFSKLRRKFRWW